MRRDQSVGCRRSKNHPSARPVRRRVPLPHCGSHRPVFRGAGGGDTFDEGATLRSLLDTGQRLQRPYRARARVYETAETAERIFAVCTRRCDVGGCGRPGTPGIGKKPVRSDPGGQGNRPPGAPSSIRASDSSVRIAPARVLASRNSSADGFCPPECRLPQGMGWSSARYTAGRNPHSAVTTSAYPSSLAPTFP